MERLTGAVRDNWRSYVPRITLIDTFKNYNKDGLWSERLVGDITAGMVTAGAETQH